MLPGDYDDDLNFTKDFNTEVYGSCASSLKGEMIILGGDTHNRQVYIDYIIYFNN